MVGFWFLEVTSVLYIVMTLNFFISGQMLPLDLLPEPWSTILKALPFQYMAYFPAVVFLGKVKGADLVWGLLGELAWAAFFVVLARACTGSACALQRLRGLIDRCSFVRIRPAARQPGPLHPGPRAGASGATSWSRSRSR